MLVSPPILIFHCFLARQLALCFRLIRHLIIVSAHGCVWRVLDILEGTNLSTVVVAADLNDAHICSTDWFVVEQKVLEKSWRCSLIPGTFAFFTCIFSCWEEEIGEVGEQYPVGRYHRSHQHYCAQALLFAESLCALCAFVQIHSRLLPF